MRVIVVNGAPTAGKSLFESYCAKHLRWCRVYSSIDFVKDLAKVCGWDGTKTPKNREFLSDLKDLLIRWDDVPFKEVTRAIELFRAEVLSYDYSDDEIVVFVDCREPQEITKLVERYNAKTLLIRRSATKKESFSNHADADVENYNYDYIIDNNGTKEEYEQQAIDFLKQLGLTKYFN